MKSCFLGAWLAVMLAAPVAWSQRVDVVLFKELRRELRRRDDTLRIFNFWATWCGPCVEEFPAFVRFDSVYRREGVRVVFVSLDFVKDLEGKVLPFVRRRGRGARVVLLDAPDYNVWLGKVDAGWQGDIPASLGVRNGRELYVFRAGQMDYAGLVAWVEELRAGVK